MTDMDRMVVWLREALDAAERSADRWHDVECLVHATGLTDAVVLQGATLCDCDGPAAVLRRIAADRKTLDLHQNVAGKCDECGRGYELSDWGPDFPCGTVRLLAEGWGWTEEESSR